MRCTALGALAVVVMSGCGGGSVDDAGAPTDAGGGMDAAPGDAGPTTDAGDDADAAPEADAATPTDAGAPTDAGMDAGSTMDAGSDAGSPPDAGTDAAASADAGGCSCAPTEYCDYTVPNMCGGAYTCRPRPDVCTRILDPHCGCDGVTYSNECVANAAGQDVSMRGMCDCRSTGCDPGSSCMVCRGAGGPVYVCLAAGTVC